MFWGLTPALDIQNELASEITDNELNIFLIGCRDSRHILKTVAQMYRHREIKINFFVIEKHLEQVARHILFISIALESEQQLGLFQKTRTFMELYGNTLLRPFVDRYFTKKALQLVEIITDSKYCEQTLPIFKIDQLKFKERDYLENVFKFWSKRNSDPFDITQCWDKRLRNNLGVRYDSRRGIFDWDYHMRLCERGGQQINSREYIHWRGTGVAFTWLECASSKPNLSLVAGIIPNGDKMLHYGYLGDIITGPYIAFGLDCEDNAMLKKVREEHIKTATDITERNVMRMFYELQTKEPYISEDTSDEYSLTITEITDAQINLYDEKFTDNKSNRKLFKPSLKVDNVQITFLPHSLLPNMHMKKMYENFFHFFAFGSDMKQHINSDLLKMAKNDAICTIEHQKHLYNVNKEDLKKFEDQVKETMSKCNCSMISEFDYLKDDYLRYKTNH